MAKSQANPYGAQSHLIDGVTYNLEDEPLVNGLHLWYEATIVTNGQPGTGPTQRAAIRVEQQATPPALLVLAKSHNGDPRDLFRGWVRRIGGVDYTLKWPVSEGGGEGLAYLASGSDQSLVAIKVRL